MKRPFDTSHLFVPGRASYVTSGENGTYNLHLTEASLHRAYVAAGAFDEDRHTQVLFAGGYPGVAQKWPEAHTPSRDQREAHLMSIPLRLHLKEMGWTSKEIAERVQCQGDSNNSLGDIRLSIDQGLLNPNDFHKDIPHGIEVVAGRLHFQRFRTALRAGLDINPALIRRVPMRDIYGTPETQFRPAESAAVAIAKEVAAIGINQMVFWTTSDLAVAETRFNTIAGIAS